jgi:hypothetical protein
VAERQHLAGQGGNPRIELGRGAELTGWYMFPYSYSSVCPSVRHPAATTFSIADLPDGIVTFESAVYSAEQVSVYGSSFNKVTSSHVSYATLSAMEGTPALHDLGVFSSSAALGARSADVLLTLSDDYANRASRQNRSQYRFVFIGNGTSDQDYACMDNNVLTVKYLFP